jgi:hypothetical protein
VKDIKISALKNSPFQSMPAAAYKNLSELETLVQDFQNKTLSQEKWTHFAHLSVGLWFVM